MKATAPVALSAVYSLSSADDRAATGGVHIEELSRREAFFELVKGTFNRHLVSPERLGRQFDTAARLSDRLPVAKLTYPKSLDRLAETREWICNRVRDAPEPRCSGERSGHQYVDALGPRHS